MSYSVAVPAVAVLMVGWTAYHISIRQTSLEQGAPPVPPAEGSFEMEVAAAGVVEAWTENVSIGAHYAGVVDAVLVREGDHVSPGAPLLRLDTRQAEADVAAAEASLEKAQAELARLRAMPRPEDVPPVEAKRRELEAALVQAIDTYRRTQQLVEERVSPEEELVTQRSARDRAQALLEQARAEEDRVKAGAWSADIAVAAAQVSEAAAMLEQAQTTLGRHTVLAPESTTPTGEPSEFTVLQINLRAGERMTAESGATPIVLGDLRVKHVRADVDEHDIHRFVEGASAEASTRGDAATKYPLEFVRVEPMVVPKKSLTGDSTERVDTRVLQVIYKIDETGRPPVYVGQQLDVFVNARPTP